MFHEEYEGHIVYSSHEKVLQPQASFPAPLCTLLTLFCLAEVSKT